MKSSCSIVVQGNRLEKHGDWARVRSKESGSPVCRLIMMAAYLSQEVQMAPGCGMWRAKSAIRYYSGNVLSRVYHSARMGSLLLWEVKTTSSVYVTYQS